ncbi:MAG: hypothetical protein O7H41_10100 [Planctomycetota bacterium]|nr:hypothetical protein [Planctomycetota bacterium]
MAKKGKRKTAPAKEKFALYVPVNHLQVLREMSEATEGELTVSYFVRAAIREYVGKKRKRR